MVMAGALSSILLVAVAPLVTNPFDVSANDSHLADRFRLGVLPLGTILLIEGTRLIPAAQSAVIGTLETPLAPVWAWLVLSELPPVATTGLEVLLCWQRFLWNVSRDAGFRRRCRGNDPFLGSVCAFAGDTGLGRRGRSRVR